MPHKLDTEKIYRKLIEIANEDGIISAEEQNLITSIKKNVKKYYEILDKSFEDDKITSEEQHNMYRGRKRVLEEALTVAKADDEISQDEMKILFALQKILDDLEKDEHY